MITYFTANNCPKCNIIHPIVEEVFAERGYVEGVDYVIRNVDDDIDALVDALQLNIAVTPAFIINGVVCFVGEVFTREEFIEMLKSITQS